MNRNNSPRHPTGFCRNICLTLKTTKKRDDSVYDKNCRCHNCECYIPRDKLIDKDVLGVKARCPCCNKTWMKGVHVGLGMKRLIERSKSKRLARNRNKLLLIEAANK
jgi:hypothetical protein